MKKKVLKQNTVFFKFFIFLVIEEGQVTSPEEEVGLDDGTSTGNLCYNDNYLIY